MSVDLAASGVNALWGSFEVKNIRLIHKMMQQFAGLPLSALVQRDKETGHGPGDSVSALADRFQELPLYFMTFHGGTDVDLVLDAMVSESSECFPPH
jgi:twinkle protein